MVPKQLLLCLFLVLNTESFSQPKPRPRELGIIMGVLPPGKLNAITDVSGVKVGQLTLIQGSDIRTGVTVVVPHSGNIFQAKVPAAVWTGNGFGKLAGTTQVKELGNIETPIVLTNTLSVPVGMEAMVRYTLGLPGNEKVASVNAVVGETNDGYLNDIRGMHVTREHVLRALADAKDGMVEEGAVGAGTGTICFGWKGGIGSSSRILPTSLGGYTVGVLVQTNFGGVLQINGAKVGKELKKFSFSDQITKGADGSCMIVVATDAPLDARNLERLAQRALLGLGKTGGIMANGSGDYVIAFSTDPALRIPFESTTRTQSITLLSNDAMSPLFLAVIEATEEAIINSLFKATAMEGKEGHKVEALPVEKVLELMKEKK